MQTDLFLFGLRSGSLDVLFSSAKKAILSLDYDLKEQRVFWVSLDTDSIRWSSLDQKTTGTLIKGGRITSVVGVLYCRCQTYKKTDAEEWIFHVIQLPT